MSAEYKLPVRSVASFGASTAHGAGDPESKGFIYRLARKLGCDAANFGVGGDTTRMMLERLPSLRSSSDVLIVVTLGINDVPRTNANLPEKRVPLDEHRGNVDRLLSHFSGSAPVLYLSQFQVDGKKATVDETVVAAYIDAGLDVARKAGVPHIDLREQIPPRTAPRYYLAEDGMHFGSEGHELISGVLYAYIRRHAAELRCHDLIQQVSR